LFDSFLQKCLDLNALSAYIDLTTLAKRSPDPPAGTRTGQICQVLTTTFPKDLVRRILYVKDLNKSTGHREMRRRQFDSKIQSVIESRDAVIADWPMV
jgi:hypothetical protein